MYEELLNTIYFPPSHILIISTYKVKTPKKKNYKVNPMKLIFTFKS